MIPLRRTCQRFVLVPPSAGSAPRQICWTGPEWWPGRCACGYFYHWSLQESGVQIIGKKINTGCLPQYPGGTRKKKPTAEISTVLCIILVPLVLILCAIQFLNIPESTWHVLFWNFLGTPFVAIGISGIVCHVFSWKELGYNGEQLFYSNRIVSLRQNDRFFWSSPVED